MIDIFNEVFTHVAESIRGQFEGVRVVGEYVQLPTSYPTVTIDEIDNIEVAADSSGRERFNRVRYRVQVFSNLPAGKRSEARAIQKELDRVLKVLGFRRTAYSTTPDIINNTVYSITTIFSAVISETGVIHGTNI